MFLLGGQLSHTKALMEWLVATESQLGKELRNMSKWVFQGVAQAPAAN